MSLFSLLSRNKRSGVLWNVTDHVVQVARLGRLDDKPLIIDSFAELAAGEDEAYFQWLRAAFPDRRRGAGYLAGYCGIHPVERVLLRETINTRRMTEPHYLANLLAEQAKLTGV